MSRVDDLHRSRVAYVENEARGLAGAALQIANAAAEVLDKGGTLQVPVHARFVEVGRNLGWVSPKSRRPWSAWVAIEDWHLKRVPPTPRSRLSIREATI
jgi:hypothetical protein